VAAISGETRSAVRERAARAWAFRWSVELLAERAFAHIADELAALGYPDELVIAARRVSGDEARHAILCEELAVELGATEPVPLGDRIQLAPPSLSREDALLYEIVARCCVAETESTATLTQLMTGTRTARIRNVVHEIARDEVRHARLGWQFLAYVFGERTRDLAVLGAHLPAMLATGGAPLFAVPSMDRRAQEARDADSADLGVFSLATQRRIFVDVLDEVVFPGLELYGIPTAHAREWLASRQFQE
jgi:hypothetical protein